MEITVIAIPTPGTGPSEVLVYVMECSECGPLGVQVGEAQTRAEVHLMRHGTMP